VLLKAIYKHVTEDCGGTGSIKQDLINMITGPLHKLAYGVAFAGGLVHGIFQSLWDTISGLAEAVYKVFKSVFTWHVVSDIEELASKVEQFTWEDIKDVVGKWAAGWADDLNSKSAWTAGHAHGYLTGYVMAEAFMLLVGAGELSAAKDAVWGSKFGEAVKATSAYAKVADAAKNIGKFGDQAAELAAKVGKIVQKTPVVGKAVRVAGKVFEWSFKGIQAILHLPSKWARTIANQLLDAVRAVPGLRDLLPEIEELSPRAQKYLFGCHNPCDFDPQKVANKLAEQKAAGSPQKIEAEAEEAERAEQKATQPATTPSHDPKTPDPKTPDPKAPVTDTDPKAQPKQNDPPPRTATKEEHIKFSQAKEALIDELRKRNRELAKTLPTTRDIRSNIERLEREVRELSGTVAADEKKYNAAKLAKNKNLKPQLDQLNTLRGQLKARNEALDAARAELNAINVKQAPILDEMGKNRKEIDELSKSELNHFERGRVNETRALMEEKLSKNTKSFPARDPVTNEYLDTIPDAIMDSGATVDVKDVESLSETQQLRLQRVISQRRGRKPVIITGEHTKGLQQMRDKGFVIITKPYLGPQK
jgi:hypothetical protein